VSIVTDGYVSVEKDAFELIRSNLGKANLFSFGIGSSVNRYIIEGMARAGMGEPFVVLNAKEADKKAKKFQQYIQSPILMGIDVKFKGFNAYSVVPKSVPDLFAKRPLIVFGKYKGEPQGQTEITGRMPGKNFVRSMGINASMQSPDNEALRYLWAREKIMYLSDMNKLEKDDKRVKEITNLGLKYNLMTDYTSFIAVDKQVRADGKVVTVKQPLPMPEGVPDSAVGMGYAPAGLGGVRMMAPMTSPKMKEESDVLPSPPVRPVRKVSIDLVTIKEGIDPTLNSSKIQTEIKLSALGMCPKAPGKIALEVTIDKAGNVTNVKVLKNATGSSALEKCVLKTLKAMQFSKPLRTSKVVAKVVIKFGP
jgi:Ca-activated chloride channel family protein